MRSDMSNSSMVESEDSLSDEYTVVVEEVHTTEDILIEPTETNDTLVQKNFIPNVDSLADETDSSNSDLSSTTLLTTKALSSNAFENTHEIQNITTSTNINNDANSEKVKTKNVNNLLDKTEDKIHNLFIASDAISKSQSKNGKVGTFACNGTLVYKINEDISTHASNEKSCNSIGKDADKLSKIRSIFSCSFDKEISLESHKNGILPNYHVPATLSSSSPVDKLSAKTNINGSYSSNEKTIGNPKIDRGSRGNTFDFDNRKRSIESHEISGSVFPNNCDNEVISSHLETKRRKILDTNEDPTNCQNLSSENSTINALPSHQISSLKNNDNDKQCTSVKKNIARKHTSAINIVKTMKDLSSAVLAEINKPAKNSSNECIRNENLELNKKSEDVKQQSSDCPSSSTPYKVNFSVDSISGDNLKNIFRTFRRTLTRRQLEEIVLQKVCEMISDSSEVGELKRQIFELQQGETHRKSTIFHLEKQIQQLKGVCQVFIEKANSMKKDKRSCTPTIITRSVGLQVMSDTTSPRSCTSPVQTVQIKHSDTNTLSNTSNDDDSKLASSSVVSNNTVALNVAESSVIESSNPSLSKETNKTPTSTKPLEDSSIIDLTDKEDKNEDVSNTSNRIPLSQPTTHLPSNTMKIVAGAGLKPFIIRPINRHPAPLPKTTIYPIRPGVPHPPPKPELTISRNNDGISLSWNMPINQNCAKIARYQIYAYQETSSLTSSDPWKPVGEVNALPLPMECTLTQFFSGYRYHFTVRAVDELKRVGPFSEASSIAL